MGRLLQPYEYRTEGQKMKALNENIRDDGHYTYADYCKWDDDKRWELIDGVAYAMSPAPSTMHQSILGALYAQLYNFLIGHPCKVFLAPIDVRLDADKDDDTVVQPDIVVICDRSKIDGKGCNGAPDLVVEIISPSSSRYDKILKFNKYLESGVKEYWLVDPRDKTVTVFSFQEGAKAVPYGETDKIPVGVLPECVINLAPVFADIE